MICRPTGADSFMNNDAGFSTSCWIDLRERSVLRQEHFQHDLPTDISPTEIFRVDKQTNDVSKAELISEAKAVDTACMAELKSWLDHGTCKPVLASTFTKATGLAPVTARWVLTWKVKEGVRGVKARLCLRGFQEVNQSQLHTASPTATRLGHRLIVQRAAELHQQVTSPDISTAFLQSSTFETMSEQGLDRQAVAFFPPPGVMEQLARLTQKPMARQPSNRANGCSASPSQPTGSRTHR